MIRLLSTILTENRKINSVLLPAIFDDPKAWPSPLHAAADGGENFLRNYFHLFAGFRIEPMSWLRNWGRDRGLY